MQSREASKIHHKSQSYTGLTVSEGFSLLIGGRKNPKLIVYRYSHQQYLNKFSQEQRLEHCRHNHSNVVCTRVWLVWLGESHKPLKNKKMKEKKRLVNYTKQLWPPKRIHTPRKSILTYPPHGGKHTSTCQEATLALTRTSIWSLVMSVGM